MIRAEPLTAAAFAPFGTVIEETPDAAVEINDGFTTRFHALAQVDCDGPVILSIFDGRPRPKTIAMLERHPHGTQAFMPLDGADWLLVVADRPDPAALRAFCATGRQGVQYARGVWHHPLLVLGGAQQFLVVDRADPGTNLEEIRFPPVSVG